MIAQAKASIDRLLPKNAFARSVSVLVGGTASAQVLTLLAAPLLTRLYTPTDFGLLAVYAALLALICVISSLRYELAIPLSEDDTEAANVAILSLLLVSGCTLLSALLVLLIGEPIATSLGVPTLADYLWLLPVGVLLSGAYTIFNYWSIRAKHFTTIARSKLRQSLATITIQVTAFKLGGVALLFGQIAGQTVGTASLGRPALANASFKQVSLRGIRRAARRYRRFPIFSTWGGLANIAGLTLPPLMFAAIFGTAAAGLYAVAYRVLTLPMSLVGNALGQVFFANAAEAHRADQVGPLVARLHEKLAHIGLLPALILMLLGPDLFAVVFGAQWREAGEFARWMAPWLYFQFVSSPLSILFAVMERQIHGMVFQVVRLILRVGVIGIGAWIGDLSVTIKLFAAASALSYLVMLLWLAKLVEIPLRSVVQPSLSALGIAVLCALPILIGLAVNDLTRFAWLGILGISGLMIVARYWRLLRDAYL